MVSEEHGVNEDKSSAAKPAGEAQSMDELLDQHVGRWQQRVQVIAAVLAAFLLFTLWFMLRE